MTIYWPAVIASALIGAALWAGNSNRRYLAIALFVAGLAVIIGWDVDRRGEWLRSGNPSAAFLGGEQA
jgi:hypothetical protein